LIQWGENNREHFWVTVIVMSLKNIVMNESFTLNQNFSVLANAKYTILYFLLMRWREKLRPYSYPQFWTLVIPTQLQLESLLNELEAFSRFLRTDHSRKNNDSLINLNNINKLIPKNKYFLTLNLHSTFRTNTNQSPTNKIYNIFQKQT
jgi:hypothetical protein